MGKLTERVAKLEGRVAQLEGWVAKLEEWLAQLWLRWRDEWRLKSDLLLTSRDRWLG